jgi:mannosyltransferase OCH1-like enzyme
MPGIKAMYLRAPRWIMRCDMARLVHVFFNGGFYCDVDCFLTQSLPPRDSAPGALHLFTAKILSGADPTAGLGPRECKTEERKTRISNHLFGCWEPHHPLLWDAIEECARRLYGLLDVEKVHAVTDSDVLWATGPDVLTSVYHARIPGSDVVLHPVGTHRHLCAGSWRSDPPSR